MSMVQDSSFMPKVGKRELDFNSEKPESKLDQAFRSKYEFIDTNYLEQMTVTRLSTKRK